MPLHSPIWRPRWLDLHLVPSDAARMAARFIRAELTQELRDLAGHLLPDGAHGVPKPFAAFIPPRVKKHFCLFGPTCLFAATPHRSFFADEPPECLSAATRHMRWAGRVVVGVADGLLGFAPVCGPCLTVSPRWTASALSFASCRVLDVLQTRPDLRPHHRFPATASGANPLLGFHRRHRGERPQSMQPMIGDRALAGSTSVPSAF